MVGTFVDCCARELRNDIETNHEGTDRAETHPLMEALLQLPAAPNQAPSSSSRCAPFVTSELLRQHTAVVCMLEVVGGFIRHATPLRSPRVPRYGSILARPLTVKQFPAACGTLDFCGSARAERKKACSRCRAA
jgi:hypothetical protein